MVRTLRKSVRARKVKLREPAPRCHRVMRWAGHQKVTIECLCEFTVTVLSTLPRDTHQFTFSPGGNWCAESKGVWHCRRGGWVSQPCGWHRVVKAAHPTGGQIYKHTHMSPTVSVTKVPFKVPHDWGTARFATEMHLLDPIFMKRRSPLDPESSRTLIVFIFDF